MEFSRVIEPGSNHDMTVTERTVPASRNTSWRLAARFSASLAVVAGVALVLRVVYVLAVTSDPVAGDGVYYHNGGVLLAEGKGFINPVNYLLTGNETPGAVHPPGWTVLLSFPSLLSFDTFLGHQLFACLVGAATVVMVGLVGRQVAGNRAGLIAAATAALYPNFWLYERELMSETLVLFLGALVLLLTFRFRDRPGAGSAAGLGVACGLLALTRSEQALLLVVLVAPLMLLAPAVPRRRRLTWLALASGTAAIVIAPWAVYNTLRFDDSVVISTNLGPTLSHGTCDFTFYGDHLGAYDERCREGRPSGLTMDTGDASTRDGELRRIAVDYLLDHASRVPIVVAAREGRTWGLFRPFQQTHLDSVRGTRVLVIRIGLFAYWLLLPAAIVGAILLWRQGVWVWPFIAFFVVVAAMVAITFGYTRYRAPVEVPIAVLAAVAIDAVFERRRQTAPLDV